MDGVLVVNKPPGPSSHDVVIVARRSLGIGRVGHTGTLDPQASGVLPLVLGQATRLAQYLSSSDKEYRATVRFGLSTDTYDASGTVVESSGIAPSRDDLEAALTRFSGTFAQTPPAYSAKMVDGERAYVRARAGKPVATVPVTVTAEAIELLSYEPPVAQLRIRCSAGFYVRSLAHDLGQCAGSGAILEALVRTEAAGFRLEDAVAFETLVRAPRPDLRQQVHPMEALLTAVPAVRLTAQGLDWARHGRQLGPTQIDRPAVAARTPLVRLLAPDGRLVGLGTPANMPGFLRPAVVFSYN